MAEKLKLKIIKVEDEETPDGIQMYKMTLQTGLGTYERGVTVSAWEDERDRRSVEKHWLKSIGDIEAAKKVRATKTEKVIKAELEAKMKGIKGTVLEEDE